LTGFSADFKSTIMIGLDHIIRICTQEIKSKF
jgi:hypothetical protein